VEGGVRTDSGMTAMRPISGHPIATWAVPKADPLKMIATVNVSRLVEISVDLLDCRRYFDIYGNESTLCR
jgi:hypothetical protein